MIYSLSWRWYSIARNFVYRLNSFDRFRVSKKCWKNVQFQSAKHCRNQEIPLLDFKLHVSDGKVAQCCQHLHRNSKDHALGQSNNFSVNCHSSIFPFFSSKGEKTRCTRVGFQLTSLGHLILSARTCIFNCVLPQTKFPLHKHNLACNFQPICTFQRRVKNIV